MPEPSTVPITDQAGPSVTGRILLGGFVLLTILAFIYFDLTTYLSLDTIKAHRDRLLQFTEQYYPVAVVLFIGLYVIQTACSLPGATIMTLMGGFLFGSVFGMLYVNIGATAGATVAFLAARYVFQSWVQRKFGDRLAPLQSGFAKNGFAYLLTLRLIPLFPFFLLNLLSGLTRVSTRTYVTATALGIIPGSFVYTFAGSQLGSINSLSEIASPRVALALTFLGLLALSSTLYRHLTERRSS
ncbi:MAG TPA: TVP38/TMEM64 family protein [Nitrospiraceae bacterium]|nr:TVP38/TMEM64 family protein [Nitrospiraceae bacterium]